MEKTKCDLCGRETFYPILWNLHFCDLESLNVCGECDLSVKEQIHDNITYYYNEHKKEHKGIYTEDG